MPFRRAPLTLVLVAALAVTGACGGDDDDDVADDDVTTTTEADEEEGAQSAPAPSSGLTVELLDPGAEPRQELRMTVEQGSEQTYVLVQEQSIDVEAGGRTQTIASASEQEVTYTVDEIGDGEIVAKTTYGPGRVLDDPPVDAATRQALEELYAAMEGAEGSSTFDDRGAILDFEVPSIELPDPQLQVVFDSLIDGFEAQGSQLATPFPEEAVGVGAVWRVTTSFEIAGLPFDLATEITLTAVGDGTADGDLTQTLSIRPGSIEIQGTSAEVVSGEIAGGGTVRWDLSSPVATIEQEQDGTVVMRIDQGGTPVEVRQTMRQRYQIRPL